MLMNESSARLKAFDCIKCQMIQPEHDILIVALLVLSGVCHIRMVGRNISRE
jgi:hypothetical protein